MKKIFLKILGLLLILVILVQYNIVVATTKTELNNSKTDTEQKIQDAKDELEHIEEEKSETLQQVEELILQISSYQSEIDKLDTEILQINSKIEEAQNKINEKQEDYNKQKELLETRLIATYEAGETSFLDVLLCSSSLSELISNYYYTIISYPQKKSTGRIN